MGRGPADVRLLRPGGHRPVAVDVRGIHHAAGAGRRGGRARRSRRRGGDRRPAAAPARGSVPGGCRGTGVALAGFGAARLAGWDRASWFTAGLTGAGVGCAALGLTGERWQRVVANAGAAVAFLGLLVTMLVAAGLDRPRVAAVTAVLVVFAVGLAPQLALGRSELVGLMRSQEAGEQISQGRVGAAVTRGQAALTGALFGIATFAAIAATVLLTSRTWSGVTLGGALGAVFALRSRAFTRAGHVVPMLVPAVVAAAVAVIALPRSLGLAATPATWLAYGSTLAIAVGLVLAGQRRLDEVAAARMRQVFDIIEVVTMLSLVPLVIAVFGGFEWAVR